MRSRRRTRRIILLILLALILAALTVLYVNYRATKRISLDFNPTATVSQIPPEYLYSFSGPDADRLSRPTGVLVHEDRVYVSDSRRGVVDVFTIAGRRVATWGQGQLKTPLYLAVNPKDGNLYVSDRRVRGLHKFSLTGEYLGTYDPALPKEELPSFDTNGVKWQPVGFDFGADGTLYVTEILKGHRLLIFGPDGSFVKSIGTAGIVEKVTDSPDVFQFPNNVRVHGDEVWVSDSNNRRMKVFSLEGEFLRLVPTSGLPRGFGFLNKLRDDSAKAPDRFVVVDTLSHDASIWQVTGKRLLNFGSNGVLEGQFSYPNDLSVDGKNRIFIADNLNSRVQVWGWPVDIQPVPMPRTPAQWGWCASPLLLLLLPFLLRKREFLVTPDFVTAMAAAGRVDTMPAKRRKWLTHEDDLPAIADVTFGELGERFADRVPVEGVPHSESDARALADRLELSDDAAKRMVLAQRANVFCTQDPELRRVAKLLEVDVVDVEEFIARFADRGERTRKR